MSLVGRTQQSVVGFDPGSIGGLAVWLDAADSNTFALSGSNVTTWRDKSGRNNHATGVGTPTATYNGSTSVVFGGSQYFTLPDGAFPYGNSSYAYFLIFTTTTIAPDNTMFWGGSNTTNQSFGLRAGNGSSGGIRTYWYNNDLESTNTITINTRQQTSTFYTAGGQRTVWVNFALGATDSPGARSQPATSNRIGNLWASNMFYGQMHEIVIYEASLSTTQRLAVEGYLARKWGLTASLPATHPYKPAPPFLRPFSPVDVDGLALWLDGADLATVTLSGSNVTGWSDKSGAGKTITVGGSGGLTYSSNSVCTSSAATSYFTVPVDIRKTVMSNMTLVMVYTWLGKALSQDNGTLWGNDNPNGGNRVQFVSFSAYSPNSYVYYLNGPSLTITELNTTSRLVYSAVDQVGVTGGSAVWVNGTQSAAGTGTSVVNTPASGNEILYFGGGETSSIYPCYAAFSEILLYSNALPVSQRQQVETYLATKWGLGGNLPSTHLGKLYKPLTVPFVPTQIASCALWLDATDLTTITFTGSNVTAWSDKSGNAVAITVGGTGGLTYSSNSVCTSSAQTSYFSVPVNITKPTMPNISLFLVYTWLGQPTSQINSVLWGDENPISGGRCQYFSFPQYSPNSYGAYMSGGVYIYTTELNTPSRLIYSYVEQYTVTNGTAIYINGALGTGGQKTSVSNAVAAGNATLYFGGGVGSSLQPSYVALSEILIYSNALPATQRQQVEGYLAWKWGTLSSLTSSNPYKTVKP